MCTVLVMLMLILKITNKWGNGVPHTEGASLIVIIYFHNHEYSQPVV